MLVVVAIHGDGLAIPLSTLERLSLNWMGVFPDSLDNHGGVHEGVFVVTIGLPIAYCLLPIAYCLLPITLQTPPDAGVRQLWLDFAAGGP